MGNWEITYLHPRDGKLTVWPGRFDHDGANAALDFAKHLPASIGTDWDTRQINVKGPEGDEPGDKADSGLLDGIDEAA